MCRCVCVCAVCCPLLFATCPVSTQLSVPLHWHHVDDTASASYEVCDAAPASSSGPQIVEPPTVPTWMKGTKWSDSVWIRVLFSIIYNYRAL